MKQWREPWLPRFAPGFLVTAGLSDLRDTLSPDSSLPAPTLSTQQLVRADLAHTSPHWEAPSPADCSQPGTAPTSRAACSQSPSHGQCLGACITMRRVDSTSRTPIFSSLTRSVPTWHLPSDVSRSCQRIS